MNKPMPGEFRTLSKSVDQLSCKNLKVYIPSTLHSRLLSHTIPPSRLTMADLFCQVLDHLPDDPLKLQTLEAQQINSMFGLYDKNATSLKSLHVKLDVNRRSKFRSYADYFSVSQSVFATALLCNV
jgi:hypothetical protein